MQAVEATQVEDKVLDEAIKSPAIAFMRLSLEIDRQIRLLLGVVGALSWYRSANPVEALSILTGVQGVTIPNELKEAVKDFWALRNVIIHAQDRGSDSLALRGIDYGLRILRILTSIRRPRYVVRYVDLPLYQDELCSTPLSAIRGVIVESIAADGTSNGTGVYPTTRSYSVGDELTWEWNREGDGWGKIWFRNPLKHGEREIAWGGSMEFAGRKLSAV